MLFYLLIPLICILFCNHINKKEMGIIDYIILIIMICICGFRYEVGTDYNLYTNMYKYIQSFPRVEFLFEFIIKLFNKYNFSVEFFFFFVSMITLSIIYISIKKNSQKPAESLFLFVCLGFFALQFNIMRQMLAAAIILYGTKYLVSRNLKKYFITVFIAGLIHTTSFIMLPFYFLSNIKFKRKTLLFAIVLMFATSLMYIPIMNFLTSNISIYSVYSNINDYTFNEAGIGTYLLILFNLALAIVMIIKKYNLVFYEKKNNIYINMFIFSFFFYFLSLKNTVMIRPGYYFSIYMIFLLPDLYRISSMKKNCKNSTLLVIIFMMYYILHLISFNEMLPYKTIFFK